MGRESVVGNLLHLAIFASGAALLGLVALASLERLGGEGRSISLRELAVAATVLVMSVGAEVFYHTVLHG